MSQPPEATVSPRLDASRFPPGFLWGTATSAYQVEGAAAEGGRTPSTWDTFARTPGATHHGDTGDIACDHYHRWPEDVALMRWMGTNAYRLSVSWPRLQPNGEGPLNPEGVAFYRQLLAALREAGIEPSVTLYHWELPQALEDAGGWPVRATAERFATFAALAVEALGDLATDWVTFNEPWCQSFLAYAYGIHAPGRRHLPDAVATAHHQLLAHGLAVRAIRAGSHDVRLGIVNILTDAVPATDSPDDIAATARVDTNGTTLFLDPLFRGAYGRPAHDLYDAHGLAALIEPGDEALIAQRLDFMGINHYHRVLVTAEPSDPHLGARTVMAEPATTELGWPVTPEGLRNVILRVHRDYPPIPLYVTENGASYADYADPEGRVHDPERVEYLEGYMGAVAEAIEAGADVRGYYHWSLMDNFEWQEGYRSRFGLVHVDFPTQRRTPKTSAHWYRELIARHGAG
ncbi:MAG TPA: GH1 family beta-glucosidase [Candidatus Limnocylindrales bacterium]|nr:GH1 family beta-glucosidase [Candidatus Limnocylindrales bacterium]